MSTIFTSKLAHESHKNDNASLSTGPTDEAKSERISKLETIMLIQKAQESADQQNKEKLLKLEELINDILEKFDGKLDRLYYIMFGLMFSLFASMLVAMFVQIYQHIK